MGKAQSKRSVDITTETKKGAEDEITEKMGKIEDFDKKEAANGDATMPEKSDEEKKDVEEVENDKDMTTEKEVDVQASGDSADPQNTETSKEDGGSVTAEEGISPLADESIKKSKKEKVKKKWSFRSISFGKKDKQKPAKNDEAAEDAAVTGADANEKTNESEDTQNDKSANENEEKTAEAHENGNATPQELNGEQQNGEKPSSDDKSLDITANTTNNTTTTTEISEPVQNETAAVSSELSEKTETIAAINETKTSENGNGATVDDTSKNGNGVNAASSDQEPQKPDETNASVETAAEKASLLASAAATNELAAAAVAATTNGEVVDQIHQNGDHGDQAAVIDKSKAQIEVNSNTDKNVSAATLDSLSSTSTSINPSNIQTQVQDLNKASSEVPAGETLVQINSGGDVGADNDNNDKPVVIENCAETEINIQTVVVVDQTVASENVSAVEVAENIAQSIEDDFDALTTSKPVEISLQEKLSVDSPPPPLPISPPPSQVSVFAFTNNEEDTIQTKTFEPAMTDHLIEEEKTEIPLAEIENSQEIGCSIPTPAAPTTTTTTVSETCVAEESDVGAQLQVKAAEEVVVVDSNDDIECQETKEEEANLSKKSKTAEEITSSSASCVITEATQLEEEEEEEDASVAFAATVIQEITETAAKIVNQHLNCDQEEQFTAAEEHSASQKSCLEDDVTEVNENTNENHIENVNETLDDEDLKMMSENELPLVVVTEQINSKAIECSLDLTETNLMHPNEEEEISSLNKSNSLDDEIHLDPPTKEFATAKDIKDNVTVAEITQDLSVTCE